MLALSSLSRNSRYVGLFWLAVWFVSSIVGTVLDGGERRAAGASAVLPGGRGRAGGRGRPPPAKTPEERQQPAHGPAGGPAADRGRTSSGSSSRRPSPTGGRCSPTRPTCPASAGTGSGPTPVWEKLAETVPAEERDRFLLDNMGPQYPWYWSAAVLAVLLGLSVCILNFRVKSLDRLK